MLYISEKDILLANIIVEPIMYRTTVCVEYTTKSSKYWEPMLKDVKIKYNNDFVAQLVDSLQCILQEVGCASNNSDELDKVSSLHCYLDEYKEEFGE